MSLAFDIAGQSAESTRPASTTVEELRREVLSGSEIAVVDVRPQENYLAGHISVSVELPYGEIELWADRLLPRRTVRIVVVDDNGGHLADASARRLTRLGFGDVVVLAGGIEGWVEAGQTLITGQYALSKALGEFIERRYHTPKISVEELHGKIAAGEELVILDTRPLDEFAHISIPGGVAAPGAELLYRIFDKVPAPDTPVVINCAGRTRAIIGAQALRNVGFPNPVVSLENGTSAWLLAGYEPGRGASAQAPAPSVEGVARASAASQALVERFGIRTLTKDELAGFQAEAGERSLYLFDVRTVEEYEAGHLPSTRSVPGGQLVQTTDRHVAVRQGRIVLIDTPDLVRSRISASWLIQLGHEHVYVYAADEAERRERGTWHPVVLGDAEGAAEVSVSDLARWLEKGEATVVDLEPAPPYFRERHSIPGSYVARRATLRRTLAAAPGTGQIVLTSEDGAIARLAAAELSDAKRPVLALAGGTRAWVEAGLATRAGLDQPTLDPSEALPALPNLEQRRVSLAAYVKWGDHITDELERDGLVRFRDGVH